jgi:hypothetical protein
MSPTKRGPGLAACTLLTLASPLAAQTTDPLFAGFRWAPTSVGSRPAGMGGAFVGLADSVKAAVANPAGLTLIPISEIGLSSGKPWIGAGFGRRRVRMAGYITQTEEARVELSEIGPSNGGFLDSSVWEAGLAVGVELHPRVRIGASLAWSRLRLEGQRTVAGAEEQEAVVSSVDGDEGHFRTSAGLLVVLVGANARALPSLRLGVSYQPGFDWSAQMKREPAAPASPIGIRRPTVITAGFAWRAVDRWTFLAQGDVIRYSEVVDALERNVGASAAASFRLPNVVEPRLGAEFSAPLWCGCGSVRLRGGLHYRSPGTLRYEGVDPIAARAFAPGAWKTVATIGASLFAEYFGNGIRLDLDSRDVFDGPDLSFGIVWRF